MARMEILLRPLSWIYAAATDVRNILFNRGFLRSRTYPMPVICVGNLSVGGTGKTPMVNYLLAFLASKRLPTAMVSRGYGRRTKGLRCVTPESEACSVGDEPLQIARTHPETRVIVAERRVEALDLLAAEEGEKKRVVVLDDAFQHRYVKAGLNILLTDFHDLFTRDRVLPEGRLRERRTGAARAQVIVVTKCPECLSRRQRVYIILELQHYAPKATVVFSTLSYGSPQRLFPDSNTNRDQRLNLKNRHIILLTGIANPTPLAEYLRRQDAIVSPLFFPDHHVFMPNDIERLNKTFLTLCAAAVITTQKDAMRLEPLRARLHPAVTAALWVQPVVPKFLLKEDSMTFNRTIEDYVQAD